MLYFGITKQINLNERTKDYIVTKGKIIDADQTESRNSNGKKRTSYTPTISYTVENKEYTIMADYSTGSKPSIGTERKVKYNPNNPSEAILVGFNGNMLLIGLGFMFALIPFMHLLRKTRAIEALIPIIFGGIGVGIVYIVYSDIGSWDIGKMFVKDGLVLIMGLMFIGVCIYSISLSIVSILKVTKPKILYLKFTNIMPEENGKSILVFKDQDTSFSFKGIFVYETDDLGKFTEGSTYEIDISKIGSILSMDQVTIDGKEELAVNIDSLKIEDFKKIDTIYQNTIQL